MRRLALLFAILPTLAVAHPHSRTDQQVAFTVGAENVSVQIAIVPGTEDGPAVFVMLDADGNGHLSDAEMRDFAASILASADLTVDGTAQKIDLVSVNASKREEIETGHGLIVIEAQSAVGPVGGKAFRFAIAHDAISPDWVVQPWIADGLLPGGQLPSIQRDEGNAAVTITLPDT